jgi:hypothetical protein
MHLLLQLRVDSDPAMTEDELLLDNTIKIDCEDVIDQRGIE